MYARSEHAPIEERGVYNWSTGDAVAVPFADVAGDADDVIAEGDTP
jgi:hypothetical protein